MYTCGKGDWGDGGNEYVYLQMYCLWINNDTHTHTSSQCWCEILMCTCFSFKITVTITGRNMKLHCARVCVPKWPLSLPLLDLMQAVQYLVFPLRFHQLSTRHCPISYSFYTLYKWLHRHWHNTKDLKYSDDSTVDVSNLDFVNFAEVERFSNWCRGNSFIWM